MGIIVHAKISTIIWKKIQHINLLHVDHLVGPTVTGPVLDPLAVLRLDNQLYILALESRYST